MTGTEMLAYLQGLPADKLDVPVMVRVGTDDYRDVYVVAAVPFSIDIHLRS